MSMESIRFWYGVPAKRGMRVEVDRRPGVIVGSKGPHLRVRFDDTGQVMNAHPTWRVKYGNEESERP